MNRLILLLTFSVMLALHAGAAEQPGQLDASRTLFSVLAAINAGGYDADLPLCFGDRREQRHFGQAVQGGASLLIASVDPKAGREQQTDSIGMFARSKEAA